MNNTMIKQLAIAIPMSFIALVYQASAKQVTLTAEMAKPVLLADKKQTTFLKVSLTGFTLSKEHDRAPINIALVLDKSGSMSGEKIMRAREAAKFAVDQLEANDIVSILAYDDSVSVLVPATKVGDKQRIFADIDKLQPEGSTALFAGVSKGAAELRKFLDKNKVNRVILLSDGQANVGPRTPSELGQLGVSLINEGITVSTLGLGLGYNEDLMVQLANKSDGNHYFIEHAHQLANIFQQELGSALQVVAQNVQIEINCSSDVRPIRVVGRDADIAGNSITLMLNQLYSDHEKYIICEVEIPKGEVNESKEVAQVSVNYHNMLTAATDRLSSSAAVRFTESEPDVEKNENQKVSVAAILQIATEVNEEAVHLRDAGKIEEAQALLNFNSDYLETEAVKYGSEQLHDYSLDNEYDATAVNKGNWLKRRKIMRNQQDSNYRQQVQRSNQPPPAP